LQTGVDHFLNLGNRGGGLGELAFINGPHIRIDLGSRNAVLGCENRACLSCSGNAGEENDFIAARITVVLDDTGELRSSEDRGTVVKRIIEPGATFVGSAELRERLFKQVGANVATTKRTRIGVVRLEEGL